MCGYGCVVQNLDKELKFDLMTGQGKTITRSAELECLRLKIEILQNLFEFATTYFQIQKRIVSAESKRGYMVS